METTDDPVVAGDGTVVGAAIVGLWTGRPWARRPLPVALGLLLYTTINSAGYYAQSGEAPVVAMFAVLTVATVAALWRTLRAT